MFMLIRVVINLIQRLICLISSLYELGILVLRLLLLLKLRNNIVLPSLILLVVSSNHV